MTPPWNAARPSTSRRCASTCICAKPAPVRWLVDGREIESLGPMQRRNVARGERRVAASVSRDGELVARVGETAFYVK